MLEKNRKTRGHAQVVRRKALKILIIQFVAICIAASLLSLLDLEIGYSAFLGGVVYLVPMAYLAQRTFSERRKKITEETAGRALADLYIGQIWKMVISAMLFAAIFVLVKPLSPFSLFGSYIAMQVLGWWLQMNAEKRFMKL